MNRKAYMQALCDALTKLVPEHERVEILRYYEEYFDDAGPEGEASVIERLGDPAALARKLAAEAGYDTPAVEPVSPKRRLRWVWALLGIAAVLAVVTVAMAALFKFDDKAVNGDFPNVTTTQSTEQIGAPVYEERLYGEDVFHAVEVEVPVANVTVRTGEKYCVEVEWLEDGRYSLKFSLSGDVLRVTGVPERASEVSYARVTITVPEGVTLREVDVETGIGDITVENVRVSEASCETGVGNIVWNGPLARDTELQGGKGDVTVNTDTITGWRCELTGGRPLLVNGTEYDGRYRQQGTLGELEIEGGSSIVLTTGNP